MEDRDQSDRSRQTQAGNDDHERPPMHGPESLHAARLAAASGVAAVFAVGSQIATITTWPTWLLVALIPLATKMLLSRIGSALRRKIVARAAHTIAAAILTAVVAAGFAGVHDVPLLKFWKAGAKSRLAKPATATPIQSQEIYLGARPLSTVTYGDRAWTLTDDARLVGVELVHGLPVTRMPVARSIREMLLCGSHLILLSSSGTVSVRRAEDGRAIRPYSYSFGGPAHAAACSSSWLWIVRVADNALVRIAIPQLSTTLVVTRRLKQEVESLVYWSDRLWALDLHTRMLIGYDPISENAHTTIPLASGPTLLLGFGPRMLAVDRGASCLRSIDLTEGRELGAGVPLTADAYASASNGDSAAIADYGAAAVTMVGRASGTYKLPFDNLRISGIALDDRRIVVQDESAERLLIFRREDLGRMKRQHPERLVDVSASSADYVKEVGWAPRISAHAQDQPACHRALRGGARGA